MKENESAQWLRLFAERAEKKNLTDAELDMVVDFGMSLKMIKMFANGPETTFVKHHLDRVQYTLDYFSKEPETVIE